MPLVAQSGSAELDYRTGFAFRGGRVRRLCGCGFLLIVNDQPYAARPYNALRFGGALAKREDVVAFTAR